MSKSKISRCAHVGLVGNTSWQDVDEKSALNTCDGCGVHGPNLWLCLHAGCLVVGCGENHKDHSSAHFETSHHCLTLNLTTKRIWCYTCEQEVFKYNNVPPLVMRERSVAPVGLTPTPDNSLQPDLSGEMEELSDSDNEGSDKVRGLIGLKNIGNTCYMNAALQALSNCPPLSQFFLDCGAFVPVDKKPGLSKSFMKLLHDMWGRDSTSYLIPSQVAHGIKTVHPMFRGYTQQDTQEFLRCFMDQLHEELRRPKVEVDSHEVPTHVTQRHPSIDSSTGSSSSPTEMEYESCDSGLSGEIQSVEDTAEFSEHPECDMMVDGSHAVDCNMDEPQGGDNVSVVEEGECRSNSEQMDVNSETKNTTSAAPEQLSNVVNENEQVGDGEKVKGRCQPESGRIEKMAGENTGDVRPVNLGADAGDGPRTKSTSEQSRQGKSRRTKPDPGTKTATRSATSPHPEVPIKTKKPVEYSSVISDVFDGKLLSSVQCLTCERFSTTKETFQDLSLPIPSKDQVSLLNAQQGSRVKGSCGEVNPGWMTWIWSYMTSWLWGPNIQLDNCLSAFFSEDELKGDNMYSCERCKKLRNGMKFSKVVELPEILCIHLKRFRHEFMFSSKISSYVLFPLTGLDMRPYLHKDFKGQVTMYDLVAVICHHGTAGGGHYTAYALNYVNEKWYEFDDRLVSMVPASQVENCEAYVLFYRKRNEEEVVRHRKIAIQLMESSEQSLMKFYVSRQWMNKFFTFAEPGPISNQDFLCKHGGVPPSMVTHASELVQSCPQPVWEFLCQRYGGGPVVNHLGPCSICQMEIEALQKRRSEEKHRFQEAHDYFLEEENPTVIYAISMKWFKEWEQFVLGREDNPPGPVDNKNIAVQRPGGGYSLRSGSDYGQVSEQEWRFFTDIYSGGPEVVYKQRSAPMQSMEEV